LRGRTTPRKVDAYVCAACGYCELYWEDIRELQHDPKSGVHFLAATESPRR
jgi:ferredoxin